MATELVRERVASKGKYSWNPRQSLRRVAGRLLRRLRRDSGISYWTVRARTMGVSAVLHAGHAESRFREITERQEQTIYPHVADELRGSESLVLDLGCGPGRFTQGLASLVRGRAIGVDPIQHLLDLAPKSEAVEYRHMSEGKIPLADEEVDIVWICLVLGGILHARVLGRTVNEVERVLAPDGLVMLVENTADRKSTDHWAFRSIEYYQDLFPSVPLRHKGDYWDLGERISILAGRKQLSDGGCTMQGTAVELSPVA